MKHLTVAAALTLALAQPAAAETLVFGQTATLPDLNPYLLSVAHGPMNNTVYDSLTRYDENIVPQPRLAESWSFSPDGTALTLSLRKDVKFHNGRPLTSADVAFSIDYIKNPAHGALIQGFAARIKTVDTPDDHTVVLNFDTAFPGVFDLLEVLFVIDKEGGGDFSAKANGTGPFSVVSHETGTRTVLVRNDEYWDGAPSLDGVEIVIIPNLQAALLALRSGDLDMITELGYVDIVPFLRDSSFTTGQARSGVAHDITLNGRRPALQNPAVRKAIDLSIDRERIARLLFGQFGKTWCLPFGPESIAFVEAANDCRFDLDEARRVLEAGGVQLPLEIGILTSTEVRAEYTTISEIMQADLAKIGINLRIDNVDAVTYRRRYVNEQDFDLASHAFGRAEKDPSSLLETTVVFKPKGNVSGFEDPAYTDAVLRGGSTPIEAERRAAYAEASRFLRDSAYVLTLMPRPLLYVAADYLDDIAFTADSFALFQHMTKGK